MTEEELMELIGKRGKETAQSNHQASDDGRQPRGFTLANADRQG